MKGQKVQLSADGVDPIACSPTPNPLIPPEFKSFRCRTNDQWVNHVNNEAKVDNLPSPAAANANLSEENVVDLTIDSNKLATFRQPVANVQQLKGIVFMFHGLDSRVGHGTHIAKALARSGYDVVGFDHRGFGKSQKTSTASGVTIQTHLADSRSFKNKILGLSRYANKNLKLVGLGLSMGGMTAYKLASQFNSVVLMAPAIQMLKWPNILDYQNLVTANLAARAELKKDPDGYHQFPPTPYLEMLKGQMPRGPQNYSSLNTPYMVVNGGVDRLVDPRVGFDLVNSSNKAGGFYYRDDMWHNVWFDREINTEIVPRIISFLQ